MKYCIYCGSIMNDIDSFCCFCGKEDTEMGVVDSYHTEAESDYEPESGNVPNDNLQVPDYVPENNDEQIDLLVQNKLMSNIWYENESYGPYENNENNDYDHGNNKDLEMYTDSYEVNNYETNDNLDLFPKTEKNQDIQTTTVLNTATESDLKDTTGSSAEQSVISEPESFYNQLNYDQKMKILQMEKEIELLKQQNEEMRLRSNSQFQNNINQYNSSYGFGKPYDPNPNNNGYINTNTGKGYSNQYNTGYNQMPYQQQSLTNLTDYIKNKKLFIPIILYVLSFLIGNYIIFVNEYITINGSSRFKYRGMNLMRFVDYVGQKLDDYDFVRQTSFGLKAVTWQPWIIIILIVMLLIGLFINANKIIIPLVVINFLPTAGLVINLLINNMIGTMWYGISWFLIIIANFMVITYAKDSVYKVKRVIVIPGLGSNSSLDLSKVAGANKLNDGYSSKSWKCPDCQVLNQSRSCKICGKNLWDFYG